MLWQEFAKQMHLKNIRSMHESVFLLSPDSLTFVPEKFFLQVTSLL